MSVDHIVNAYFRHNSKPGEVGIEIEMEGDGILWMCGEEGETWSLHHDGSLRGNSAEYVLTRPVKRNEVDASLTMLKSNLDFYGFTIHDSIRAGVHAHINVGDLTFTQVLSFACAYFVLEIPLVNWCGPNRVGNHFCLRTTDAEYLVDHIIDVYKLGAFRDFNTDAIRYASLNFKALPRYGSLEFRALQTSPDFNVISDWVKVLLNIKDYSLKYKHPRELIDEFSQQTPEQWAELVLGDKFHLIADQPNLRADLIQGMRIAQDIAYFAFA